MPRFSGSLTALLVGALLALAGGAAAQNDPPDPVREAIRLREAGDLAGAAGVLRARLAREPEDAEAIRLLAQTLYWLGDRDSARATYETALALHPADAQLRLDYGRMLVELRQDSRARQILTPLLEIPSATARAATLLGTASYWEGDFTGAVRHFRVALRADSTASDARRQWREIAAATAPWIRFGAEARHDDQPLDRLAPGVEAGWFLTPLWSFGLRGETAWHRLEDDAGRPVLSAAGTLRGYSPSLRLETEASGGLVRRSYSPTTSDWTGRLAARVRLPGHTTLGVRAERRPYLYTTASLDSAVMVREAAATFALDHPRGWLGEVSYARQGYPDRNTSTAAYAWLLAPLVHGDGASVRAGYAVGAQHADQSRFVLADPDQPYLADDPRFNLAGRYAPYYTPDHLVSHSVAVALRVRPAQRTAVSLNGSYAFYARDDAPVLLVTGTPPAVTLSSSRRAFSPWQARAALEQGLAPGLTLFASFEHGRTVFYSASTAGLQLVYRFFAAALKRVDRF